MIRVLDAVMLSLAAALTLWADVSGVEVAVILVTLIPAVLRGVD